MTKNNINKGINPEYYESKMFEVNAVVNPFGNNRVSEIAYKKAERLALATYLVTNLVPENESVRENIRSKSQCLLSDLMKLHLSCGKITIEETVATARQIVSLLDITYASGFISKMNLEVLKDAYSDFTTFLAKSQTGDGTGELELENDFFDHLVTKTKSLSSFSKGQKNRKKEVTVKDIVKDTKVKEPIKDLKSSNSERPRSVRVKRRTINRRIAIIDIVTKRNPVHIKDISLEMPDCSEKTIQRELANLVKDSVVKKEGSKRWTTYSLVV